MTTPHARLQRLAALAVSSVCDADKSLSPLDPGIGLIADHGPICGPARLVVAADDHLPVLSAVIAALPGDVLVIVNPGGGPAVLGEIFAAAAAQRGLAGIVIDGLCRDLDGLRGAGISVYARGTTPASGSAVSIEPAPAVVRVGGVDVREGEIVLGDRDGLVIAPEQRLLAALETAEAIERAERAVLDALRAGTPIEALLNHAEHMARLREGEQSALAFTAAG